MTLFQKILLFGFVSAVVAASSMFVVVDARKTRDSVRVSDMALMQNMLEVGFYKSVRYPATGLAVGEYAVLGQGGFSKLCLTSQAQPAFTQSSTACDGGTLLERIPRDPDWVGSNPGVTCANDPRNDCEYSYAATQDGKNYQIRFRLEGPTGSLTCARYPCIKALSKDGLQ